MTLKQEVHNTTVVSVQDSNITSAENNKEEIDVDIETKFHWRKLLIEKEKAKWKKDLLAVIEDDEKAKKVIIAKEKWRCELVSKVTEDQGWKIDYILEAIDEAHGKLIESTEDETIVMMLGRIKSETYWKLAMFRDMTHKLDWMMKFLDQCENEDLATIILRCCKIWQQEMIASSVGMEVWRAECLANCKWKWQGDLVMGAQWEALARSLVTVECQWKGEAMALVEEEDKWKLNIIKNLNYHWQVKAVQKGRKKEIVMLLVQVEDKSRLERILDYEDTDEWKKILLCGDIMDWKFDMLLSIRDEEKANLLVQMKSKVICEMMLAADESWKLNSLVEAARGGFWLCRIMSRVEEQWQARLVLLGQRENMEQWRIEQIPNIKDENIAANFLFNPRISIPRWKFQLGLEVSKAGGKMCQQKIEMMFKDYPALPRWKAEMVTKCEEDWRLVNLDKVKSEGVGKIYMETKEEWKGIALAGVEEQWRAELVAEVEEEWKVLIMLQYAKREEMWRMKLVKPLNMEWQVKLVFSAQQVWKAEMIARLKENEEMRGREIMSCSTEDFAQQIMGGLMDIYYA